MSKELIQGAADDGLISIQSLQSIQNFNLGAQIQAGLGTCVDDLPITESALFASIVDNSGSINGIKGGQESVCAGQNLYLDTLRGSKNQGVMVGQWLINQKEPLHGFLPVEEAHNLVVGLNYSAAGDTWLYYQTFAVLSTIVAKIQEFSDAGVPSRAVLCIITDGRDEDYTHAGNRVSAKNVSNLINDLRENLLVFFMGIAGNEDFHEIAKAMGIQKQFVLTPGDDEHELRKAFEMVSRSSLQVSQQGQAGFSNVQAGGFTD